MKFEKTGITIVRGFPYSLSAHKTQHEIKPVNDPFDALTPIFLAMECKYLKALPAEKTKAK